MASAPTFAPLVPEPLLELLLVLLPELLPELLLPVLPLLLLVAPLPLLALLVLLLPPLPPPHASSRTDDAARSNPVFERSAATIISP